MVQVILNALGTVDIVPLTGVTFPDSLKKIGAGAFEGAGLTEVKLAHVVSVGENAFFGCTALETLTFAAGCAADIGDTAFMDCTALKSVTIPGTIKTVSAGTFFACTALESVVIEEGVELIGSQAFQNCTKLASLSLPASVASIGSYAFSGSDALYAGAATAPAGSVAAEYIKNLNALGELTRWNIMLVNKSVDRTSIVKYTDEIEILSIDEC